MDIKTKPYKIRRYLCGPKTSKILGFFNADEAKEYAKNYIAHNALDLFFGGVHLYVIRDGVSEKNMMRNVVFQVPEVLTMSHLGFNYDPTFKHDGRSARDTARDILRDMGKGDLTIDTDNPLAWRLSFNLNSRIIILFDFPFLFRVKPSFAKIESLKKQLQEKDTLEKRLQEKDAKIDSLKYELVDLKMSYVDLLKSDTHSKIESLQKQLTLKDTEIDILNHQLSASKITYMSLLGAAKSYVAVVECPPCVYTTEDVGCKYICEECGNCGKRHLNCKGCEYHAECQECGDRCCNTCGEKCPICKGYTCYDCAIVCTKCHPYTPME